MIIESQKQDRLAFEGIIELSKKWNGSSFVEMHRSNPNTSELGIPYPSNEIIERMIAGRPLIDLEPAIVSTQEQAGQPAN